MRSRAVSVGIGGLATSLVVAATIAALRSGDDHDVALATARPVVAATARARVPELTVSSVERTERAVVVAPSRGTATPAATSAPVLVPLFHEDDEDGRHSPEMHVHDHVDTSAACADALAALRKATDEEQAEEHATRLIQLLEEPPTATLVDEVTDIARRDPGDFRRVAAMRLLGELPHPDAERVKRVSELAREGTPERLREASAVALGVIGSRGMPDVSAVASRAALAALEREPSPLVRAILVHAVHDTTDTRNRERLEAVLARDLDPNVREAAALVLAGPALEDGEEHGEEARR